MENRPRPTGLDRPSTGLPVSVHSGEAEMMRASIDVAERVCGFAPEMPLWSGRIGPTEKGPATAGTVPGVADYVGVDVNERTCAVDNCQKPVQARGWCGTHYQRWRTSGDVRADVAIDRSTPEQCSVENCDKPHDSRGWCKGHYSRWIRYGDVLADKPLREMRQATPPCRADGCEKPGKERGLCTTHGWRLRNWGTIEDRPQPTLEDRFWTKVNKTASCWLWTGSASQDQYGQFRYNNKQYLAHRMAYELVIGPIPAERVIDHLCRVPACVNPAHMEVVSNGVNVLRGESPTAVAYRTGKCVRGHEFTPENTYRWPRRPFTRACKTCARERQRRRYWEQKEAGK